MSNGAEKIIYSMMRVSKAYHNKVVLKDISLSYFYGAKIGVLGLNGSGKSSLLRIMAGVDREYGGEAVLSPGYTLGFLEQEPQLDPDKTVKAAVEEGLQAVVNLVRQYNEISDKFAEPMSEDQMNQLLEKQGQLQEQIDHLDAWDIDSRLEMAMDALRCPPGDTPIRVLSGGEKRRVALCRLLLQKPDILLLDEPTNHLDAETVAWLEHHLQQYAGTVIAVTHDRYFLDNVAGWILELDRGVGIPWKGNYSSWLEQKQARLQQQEKTQSERQKTLQRELEWIHMSPKGRHAKGKARINAYETLLNQDSERQDKDLEIFVPPGPRLGTSVIKAANVSKGYGDRLLFENLSFDLPAGGIVGIIGPNGAGKTTLFKMIVGKEKPDSGTITIGATVKLAYVDQDRDTLDPSKSVWEVISGGLDTIRLGKLDVNSRAYVARFNFLGTDQQKKVDRPLRRRAQPRPPGLPAQGGRQRPPAGRADQRPGRQHDAGPGRGPGSIRRLCRGSQPRPVVPGPHRHPHPRLRGRQHASGGSRATTPITRRTASARLGKEADAPHRIKYRHLVRK